MALFADYQLLIFVLWVILASIMFISGRMRTRVGLVCPISVILTVGHIALITFGILGAGFSPGILFPGYDAFIDPFLLFFFGVPIVTIFLLVGYVVAVFRARQIQIIESAYVASSLFMLWAVWFIYVGAISSV